MCASLSSCRFLTMFALNIHSVSGITLCWDLQQTLHQKALRREPLPPVPLKGTKTDTIWLWEFYVILYVYIFPPLYLAHAIKKSPLKLLKLYVLRNQTVCRHLLLCRWLFLWVPVGRWSSPWCWRLCQTGDTLNRGLEPRLAVAPRATGKRRHFKSMLLLC